MVSSTTPGGFRAATASHAHVERVELVSPSGRLPIDGATCAGLAAAVGVEASRLREVYDDGPDLGIDDVLAIDEGAAAEIVAAFERGDEALRSLAPGGEPVLWPEHFDVGITLGEVNYGISPGDSNLTEPYAYVGPWAQMEGDFWNMPFGAARVMRQLPDSAAVLAFFQEGERLAAR